MQTLLQTTVLHPMQAILIRLANVLPLVIWAIVLIGVGSLLAKLLRQAAERVFKLGQIDSWCEKAGLSSLTAHLGLGRSPSKIVSVLIWWFIFLIFFVAAANALGLNVVSELLNRFVLFIPKLLSALFVLAVGVLISSVVRDVVLSACSTNKVRGALTIAKLSRGAVIGFAAFMAMEQIGIAYTVTTTTLQIILGSVGLAAALAFGLGSKEVAGNIVRHLVDRE